MWLLKYTMLSMIFTKSNYTNNRTNSNVNASKNYSYFCKVILMIRKKKRANSYFTCRGVLSDLLLHHSQSVSSGLWLSSWDNLLSGPSEKVELSKFLTSSLLKVPSLSGRRRSVLLSLPVSRPAPGSSGASRELSARPAVLNPAFPERGGSPLPLGGSFELPQS